MGCDTRRLVAVPSLPPNHDDLIQKLFTDVMGSPAARAAHARGSGLHEFYQEVGRRLFDYHISSSVAHFNEAYECLVRLGRDVAYLAMEFQDTGLIEESFAWFGMESGTPYEAFQPAVGLRGKAPFVACPPELHSKLYLAYMKGLAQGFVGRSRAQYGGFFSP